MNEELRNFVSALQKEIDSRIKNGRGLEAFYLRHKETCHDNKLILEARVRVLAADIVDEALRAIGRNEIANEQNKD